MKQCRAAGAAWPSGTILTLGPRRTAPGRMWFLGFAPSTPFLPIFLHLHSASAPNRKGAAPINTSHTCQEVTAARFTAQTSWNFNLPYCTFHSWLEVSCTVLSPRRKRNEAFLLQPLFPLPLSPWHLAQASISRKKTWKSNFKGCVGHCSKCKGDSRGKKKNHILPNFQILDNKKTL